MSLLKIGEIDKIDAAMMSESGEFLADNANGTKRTVQVNQATSANVKAIKEATWNNPEIRSFRESFKKKGDQVWGEGKGFDFADAKKFPVREHNFSWGKVSQKCGHQNVAMAFREADTGSMFPQVLRAGVQSIMNNAYLTVPTTFESWTSTVASKKDTELYAPLQGISFLSEVGKKELYIESAAAGLDISLKNRKFGEIYAVERELLEDDQTGQFAKQTSLMGEYCKLAIEVYCYGKLAGQTTSPATYATLAVPPTETQPSTEPTYPWTTAFVAGGGRNRPDTFQVLGTAGITAGFIGLMNQKNMLGLKMSVDPNTLVVGPQNRFDAAVLLNSSFYPSVPGSAGTTGSTFSINPIESIAKLVVSRFMFKNDGTVDGTSKAWYLMDGTKPWFTVQMRSGPDVIQEAPNSGQAFDRDIVRFRCDIRFNCDFIDPRFAWQGNDGSITS